MPPLSSGCSGAILRAGEPGLLVMALVIAIGQPDQRRLLHRPGCPGPQVRGQPTLGGDLVLVADHTSTRPTATRSRPGVEVGGFGHLHQHGQSGEGAQLAG